jgi:hypothetical protein
MASPAAGSAYVCTYYFEWWENQICFFLHSH